LNWICIKNIQKLQQLGSSPSNHYWDYLVSKIMLSRRWKSSILMARLLKEVVKSISTMIAIMDWGPSPWTNIVSIMNQVWNTVAKNRFAEQKKWKIRQLAVILKVINSGTWGPSCCCQLWDLSRSRPGFDPLCARLSPPRCLTCSWACRVSSGPWGIVVVRASWPGHPT